VKATEEDNKDKERETLSSDRRYDTGVAAAQIGGKRERETRNEPIAVIGIAGFFPGSTSLEDFCSRLDRQESLFIKPPANHFPASRVSERYGAFLSDISQFDPDIFKITAIEAEYLDPRQRLLLMSVWHSLEDACYLPEVLAQSRTDVYIASEGSPYGPYIHAAEITPYSPTGPSSSSLPNRISHAFRFRGKSIFMDTACSGSLVAIHQAMQALRRNEADYAVVGAANLLFGDEVSLAFLGQESLGIVGDSQGCYPFQNSARGFLPAEGVVTVILKRLADAIRDNDNIHAVLLGSHINHAGGSGTFSMPSAQAQSEAIVGAYVDAQVSPWTVTYIEAHGASSVLADAEEIQAFKSGDRKLRDLFKVETSSPCKISTIKPNIGHANCVSGLMSLVRVVHSLKNATKLGIKNFSALSDRISLDGTRFYINEKTESWEQLIDERGAPIPRRAAINNFGAGGVNVHLLLEEFVRPAVESTGSESSAPVGEYFLALSALQVEQLQNQVRTLSKHISHANLSIPPGDLEVLFIASRTAFPCRLVFRYKNLNELLEKLRRYEESNGLKGYHLKRDTRDKNDSIELFYKHPRLSEFLSSLSRDSDKAILFELWSLGIEEPIRSYYRGSRCLKRSLPRYPFALREFWVQPRQRNAADHFEYETLQISPLLHRNTSDLSEQKYTSLFSGDEFFLAEHVVKGQRVLPGVAYLEMARAAIAHASQSIEGSQGVRLKNVVWTRPIIVDGGPKAIHIRLKAGDTARVDFEIYSVLAGDPSQSTVHCQGIGSLMSGEKAPILDIEKLQRECNEFTIDPDQCYRSFKAVGIDHGQAFQGLEGVHGKAGQVIAKIVLPAGVVPTESQFVLHPSIMDSAFQASLGLVSSTSSARLPFALQELEVFCPCSQHSWAIISNSAGWSPTSKVKKVDIDLCDTAGNVCVRMRGFATRPVEDDLGQTITVGEQRLNHLPASGSEPEAEDGAVLLPVQRAPGHRLPEHIEAMMAGAVRKFLRISGGTLDHTSEFSSFGFDSVSLTAFANELNRTHRLELDPTLFFEHTTIRQFAEYLALAHTDYFAKLLAVAVKDAPRLAPKSPEKHREDPKPASRFSRSVKPSEESSGAPGPEPIAIVGMSGRFPMAEDLNEFWQNLAMGRDCISEVPAARWDWKEIYGDPKTEENKTNIKWGGFISGVDEFDPLFFGISPKEAELMDPQQRLLLMFIWNAIEDAGYSAQRLSGTNTGILVGTGASGYSSIIAKANTPIEAYTSTGMVPSVGPNRMSYYLNFHGPSEPIETACSSSLVAIHRAVVAIRTGSCDMAIAGGVSTILTPDLHISFSKAGMLCQDGRCKTFSDRANGYVRGEGAGILFLKKLKDAELAGDHIYGVILGTAENHGGRTNSLTAPNPKAQADVVMAAHRDAGIDSRTISYIEAHGTGTGLGDPIEINGLKMAFSSSSPDSHCGVGSVKTNIGHLEVAAGVSGVIKVLLQMKHKRLVKSLHCENVNPYIQIDKSPFYIVKEATDWQALRDDSGRDLPRRAGVSSFGFGGVNAHVVIEEYVHEPVESTGVGEDSAGTPGDAVLLSAKNADRLQARVRQLHDYLHKATNNGGIRIADIAFTLQVGRDAMDERLALIVDSVADLEEKLTRILAGHEDIENVFRGKAERNDALLSIFSSDDELGAAVGRWLQRGKVKELCELWVKGLPVDWEKLHRSGKPRRINLPAYPFAKQRCWVTNQPDSARPAGTPGSGNVIHPLVHNNTSTLREQRYSSTFSGHEYFLADHVLEGTRILPGVVYLEMTRAAIYHATKDSGAWDHVRFRKVAWVSPFTVGQESRKIEIVLSPEPDGSIAFEVFSEDENSERNLHFRGLATGGETTAARKIDLEELRAHCNLESMSSEKSYEMAAQLGFQYGPSFRALGHVYKGIEQGVAAIHLPAPTAVSLNEYVLHPSIMDAALQASMALVLDLNSDTPPPVARPALPYFADEIEILRPCTESMWAATRYSRARNSENRNIKTCDIDVCDESGDVCVRLKGLSFIVLVDETSAGARSAPVTGVEERVADQSEILDEIRKMLTTTVSAISKVDPGSIELDRELTQYGFDSISLMALSDALNKAHNLDLTPAVLFEYPSIRSLAAYLFKKYEPVFETRYGADKKSTPLIPFERREPDQAAEERRRRFLSNAAVADRAARDKSEDAIAIVGISGRFPMADDLEQYWDNLSNGRDCIREIPPERWDWKEYFGDPHKDGNKTRVKWGGFISGIDEFDPSFFGISPQEAELMDPNQRLLMMYAWKAIEDAGYSPQSLSGSRTAILVGLGASGYHSLVSAGDAAIQSFTSTGMAPCFGPNRMSYFLDFHGPSEPIETACSSSLIALHRARILIQNNICDMAVVGGINTIVTPLLHISFSKAGMLSEEGKCRPFSDNANGYVRGEGVGMLFVKRLKDAEQAGDHIYGVVAGSAENHGGHSTWLTAPNPQAQAEVVRTAYSEAGVDPRTVTFIEAHGTGTGLGDAVEINALKSIFNADGARCGIGSVKSNIGHLELAAGVAGIIKILLQLKHKRLVKSLHCEGLSPYIDLKDSPFYILQEARDWHPIQDRSGSHLPRRAGISSFGFGGVNAHILIEEYVKRDPAIPEETGEVKDESFAIVMSAKSPERLQTAVRNLHDFLERSRRSQSTIQLSDLAYTLQIGRDAMEERLGIIVSSLDELRQKLEKLSGGAIDVEGTYWGTVKRRETGGKPNVLEIWLKEKSYARILDLWVQGLLIDWSQFYRGARPHRLSLPTYPFAGQKYWIETYGRKAITSITATPSFSENPPVTGGEETLLFRPVMVQSSLPAKDAASKVSRHVVALCGAATKLQESLSKAIDGVHCVHIESIEKDIDQQFEEYSVSLLEETQRVFGESADEETLIQVIVPVGEDAAPHERYVLPALKALLAVAERENPRCHGQLIAMNPLDDLMVSVERIRGESRHPESRFVEYSDGLRRRICAWEKVDIPETAQVFWKDRGIYLITGGAGGLGSLIAREIACSVDKPTLILTGRSTLDDAIAASVEEIERLGARVCYWTLDITNRTEVAAAISRIQRELGGISGVIHAAGIVRDKTIVRKRKDEFSEVLAPKVKGLVNLDLETQSIHLDCFLLFSSAAAIFGNPGQADYATANAFMDAYSSYRNRLVAAKQRYGRTLSINWPLWKEGGMKVPPDLQKAMEARFGMVPMPTTSGIQALSRAFASREDQILVLHGAPDSIEARLFEQSPKAGSNPFARSEQEFAGASSLSLEDYVRKTVAHELCGALAIVDTGIIDFDDSFGDYGLDSMAGIQVVQRINREFGIELNITSLFDYTTVNQLTTYIVTKHGREISSVHEPPDSRLEDKKESESADRKRPNPKESGRKEPIAIIGMSGRFARSGNLEELWENLAAGSDLVEEVTRWDLPSHYAAESLRSDNGCRYGGLLHDIDRFDPMFFNISALEATYMDPQQRLFLEESWRALEDAGYAGQGTEGLSCGVYVGCSNGDYYHLFEGTMPAQAFWGNAASIIPARIAYYMNLQGPAIAIDTACSSSLVSIHVACQGLWAGETEMALAGGVYVQATPAVYVLATRAGMLSPTGRCHTFDQAADGFVPGEGVGVLVLKRLNDAIDAGDHIYGVIRGSGINQDGRTNGITAPSSKSQERLEREVYESFQVRPEDIQMVEAHGTGTRLGDPIEFEALTRAFRKDTDKKQYCAIGSIKTNLGHAATAAGVAGVMRVLLSLQHRQIPPSLNFAIGNENICFDESPFYVNTQLKNWDVAPGKRRCAAVSSFSFSGTNAHMVLEEAPVVERKHEQSQAYLIVLSARTEQQLSEQAYRLREYCLVDPTVDCGNMSYTLLLGRKQCNHRLAVIVRNVDELITALKQWSSNGKSSKVQVSDLGQKERQQPTLLKRHGNECIGQVNAAKDPSELLEHLAVVAELYLQGYQLDYHNLFASGGYSRLPLPTYPFSSERYWIPSSVSANSGVLGGDGHGRFKEAADEVVPQSIVQREKTIASRSLSVNSGSPKEDSIPPEDETSVGAVTLLPVWDSVAIDKRTPTALPATDRVVVIGAAGAERAELGRRLPSASFLAIDPGDSLEKIRGLLEGSRPVSHLFWIVPRCTGVSIFDEAILEEQDKTVLTCFRLIKALLVMGYGSRDLAWTVITFNSQPVLAGENLIPVHAGLHGLLGSAAQEYANWHVRLVDVGDEAWSLDDLFQLPADPRGAAWACRSNAWYRRHLIPCNLEEQRFSYRDAGVYVVIGGAGGIGEIWSEFVIRHHDARVIWIGRRPQDDEISRKLQRLSAFGHAPIYISIDAASADDLLRAYREIKKRYSVIHGVIHSAVGVFDQSLAEMPEERFKQGLSAKVNISVRMAQVFRLEPLDFIVFFSSIDSFTTSHGKASYTAGCAFMDAYANQLSRELPSAVKVMNWGYWGDIGAGAVVPETSKHRLARSGVGAIEPDEGMKALSALLEGPFDQLAFMKITRPISMELLGSSDSVSTNPYQAPDVTKKVLNTATLSIAAVPVPRRDAEEEKQTKSTEDLLCRLLLCQLELTGWFHGKTLERLRLGDLRQRSNGHRQWLEESLAVLSEKGHIHSDGELFSIVNPQLVNAEHLWSEWDKKKKFWFDEPSTRALVSLVEQTLQALPEILAGRQSATSVIFPNSSMKLVEGIYKHNRVADYFNDLLSLVVVAYIDHRVQKDPSATIRILEIGAGTGGISAGIFDKLQPFKAHVREYCYTDVSKAFLIHGQREYFPKNSYLTFKLYDVEHPEKAQDIEPGRFDLVIASNVLHATRNISRSLRNAKALLQKNGLLLINEINSKTIFSHLTFGLLEGWWLGEDPEIRIPGCPGLIPQSWKRVMEQEGFDSVSFPGIHAHDLGQHIIIGRSNGMVRSKTPSRAESQADSSPERISGRQSVDPDERLLRIVSRVTQVEPQNLEVQLTWTELGLDSILSMQVIQEIESEFGLRIYPNELIEHDTLQKLQSFLAGELRNRQITNQPSTSSLSDSRTTVAVALPAKTTEAQKPLVFIVSTPRAGSTLLRVMLAGHPQLFSPPELHLLPFSHFGERSDVLKANHQQFLEEGLTKTLCELKGIGADDAKAITSSWALQNISIKSIYQELQSLCPTKLLVDKSPSYAADVATLERAESLGANPFYIHLVRHPLAVMESFVRNRFDKLFSIKEDPWAFAAQLWHRYNANIDKFLSGIPSERWIRIRYEDLVAQPLTITRELLHRMNLEFDARVLDPYEGDRMTGGLHNVSLPLSDPNFKIHNKIEPELGTAWEANLDKSSILGETALSMAESYGYRFVKDQRHKLLPAQEAFLSRFGENPVWHIVHSVRMKLDGGLDLQRLKACLQQLVARHASLRNSFKRENGSWFQEEGDTYSVPVFLVHGSGLDTHQRNDLVKTLRSELHTCVDGRTRVNLSCGVVDLGNFRYQFILVLQHLVADGLSMLRLQRDLFESYLNSESEPLKPVADNRIYTYLEEIEARLTPAVLNEHKKFWQTHIDSPRYSIPSDQEHTVEFLDDVASESEYRVKVPMSAFGWPASRSKREFFLHLSGALYQCLSAWAGLPDIVVAHRLHRRNIGSKNDFSDVLGWFAGDVPIKVTVNPKDPLSETAATFRDRFASVSMGGLSYEMLANAGDIPHCHEVCPVRLNYFPGGLVMDDVETEFDKFEAPSHRRLYVLDLIVSPNETECLFLVRYSRKCFPEASMSQLVSRCVEAFRSDEGVALSRSALLGGA
jgi:acyl transferase domain-containing protein/ubiquinone/menaquinone biosynthesis C-methylase UbiE